MPVETRLQLVLAVLAHEMTVAEAARRHGVSAESINRWRNRFVDAGKAAMEDGMPGKAGMPRQPGRATAARGDPGAEARTGRGDSAAADLAEGLGVRRPGPFADLEALRAAAELPVARFAALAGIPERTYHHRRLATLRSGDAPVKGPWPTPAVDAAEALAAKYAADWPAWGHRKIAAMMRADGHQASTSTVERALRRRGLLLPRGFRADRKSWAALRRKVFHDPPTERNRVWQTDFSEFETAGGGIWRICAVIDYATKYCLAARITPTGRGVDALACLDAAVDEAERVLGLDDLSDDRGELELVDENTGEVIDVVPAPIAVVSDNGSCFRGETYQSAFAGDEPLLRHVRTRIRSPQTNGALGHGRLPGSYEELVAAR